MHEAYRDFKKTANCGKLLRKLGEFLVEFVNTTSGVDKFHFTGEERVAESGNFHLDQRVRVSVFPGGCFFGIRARFTEERFVRRNVFEHYGAIAGRVNIFFHDYFTENLL